MRKQLQEGNIVSSEKGYKALMISVLAQAITDYIQAIRVGGFNFSKRLKADGIKKNKTRKEERDLKAMARGNVAESYIFDNSKSSEEYVFGFKFICRYIEIDPERFRKRIKEKRRDFMNGVYIS